MEFENVTEVKKTGWGYELENPIKIFGPQMSYGFLNMLRHKEGSILKWMREGAIRSETTGHLVDKYSIYVMIVKNNDLANMTFLKYTMYIDMYYMCIPTRKPEDFI